LFKFPEKGLRKGSPPLTVSIRACREAGIAPSPTYIKIDPSDPAPPRMHACPSTPIRQRTFAR